MSITISLGIECEEFKTTGMKCGNEFIGGTVTVKHPVDYTFKDCEKVTIEGIAVNCTFLNCKDIQGNRVGCTEVGTNRVVIPLSTKKERDALSSIVRSQVDCANILKATDPGLYEAIQNRKKKKEESRSPVIKEAVSKCSATEIIDGVTHVRGELNMQTVIKNVGNRIARGDVENESFTGVNEVIIYGEAKNCIFQDCQKVTIEGVATGCTIERCGWVIGHVKDSYIDHVRIDDREVQIQWTPPRTAEDVARSRDIALAHIRSKYA